MLAAEGLASRLKSIVRFAGVAPGATASLPHGLVWGQPQIAVMPDHIERSNGDFIIVSADATSVTVQNNGTAAGSCDVFLEHWHTIERAFGNIATTALVPQPFIPDNSGGGGGSGAPATCFVYRPGGSTFANVYASWSALVAALALVQGPKCIWFDASLSAITIPSGAPYDMTNVTWEGNAAVSVAQGASFTGLRSFDGRLTITYAGPAGSPPVNDLINGDVVSIRGGASIVSGSATVAFFQVPGAGATVTFIIANASLGGSTNEVIHVAAASTVVLNLFDGATILPDAVSSVAGGTVTVSILGNSARITGDQTGVLGTEALTVTATPRFNGRLATGSPVAASFGDALELPSAPYTVTLPALFAPYTNGFQILVKLNSSNSGAVTVTPAGGNTIDNAASYVFSNATGMGAVLLEARGTNWQIVGAYPSGAGGLTVTAIQTGAYAAAIGELVRCNPSAGGFTVTLPSAAGLASQKVGIKNVTSSQNRLTIQTTGGETLDGGVTTNFWERGWVYVEYVSDGTNWMLT